MPRKSSYLEADLAIMESNLRFVKNEMEDEFESLFGGGDSKSNPIPNDSNVVLPTPGFCLKFFKVNTNEKFFINICQTSAVPPPENISEEEFEAMAIAIVFSVVTVQIHLADEFDILQIVGEGWFGKILLVEHRATDTEMVLKALPKPYVSLRDFYREFHYGLHLGVHKNIVTTYDVAFETAGFYVFTQEYALLGDLTSNVTESGIGELHSKRVAKQIASALDFMHAKGIVHRDVKLDNVLIYKSDFSRVKLCDFGESYKVGTIVERRNEWLPYSPPEVLQIKTEGTYKADTSHDVWQFGILIFVCLTGCLPWQKAAPDDPRYVCYIAWHSSNMVLPFRRTPKLFKLLSSRGARMFRKYLEPREEKRPKNLAELSSFMDDRWLAKGAEKNLAESEQDELCASMYSFHSSPEEKNKLLATLAEYGIETTVDRVAKKNRIKDWIESSVITEEEEDDDSNSNASSATISREPVPGHISSIRAEEAKKEIRTTLKDASQKHFDPRTGEVQTGPSEMGAITTANRATDTSSNVPNGKNGSFDKGSIVTLASRNDLILSEGQSYQSNLNLTLLHDEIDDEATAEPMVNASRHRPQQIKDKQNNQQSNITAFSNMFLYDDSISRSNPNANRVNPSLFYRNYDHINKRYSASELHVNYMGTTDLTISHAANITPNNSNSAYCNSFSFNNSFDSPHTEINSHTSRFQSITNISVPENDRQRVPTVSFKNDGYGPGEKIKSSTDRMNGKMDISMPTLNGQVKDTKRSLVQSNSNNNSYNDVKKGVNGTVLKSLNNGTSTTQIINNYPSNMSSMKDTPYDRVRVKKISRKV